jgi:hypothetical protein
MKFELNINRVNTISVLREWNIRTELCDVLQWFVSGKVDVHN